MPAALVITARAENYIYGRPDLDDTIARLRAYQEAGADALYAPGLSDRRHPAGRRPAVDRPVNVLALPGAPTVRSWPRPASPASRSAARSRSPRSAPSSRPPGSYWTTAPTGSGRVPAWDRARLGRPFGADRGLASASVPGAGGRDCRRFGAGRHGAGGGDDSGPPADTDRVGHTQTVDVGAWSLKDLAVNLFGTNDKAALIVGIVVVSLAVGAAIGLAAAAHFWVGPVAFSLAAVVEKSLAALLDPQASVGGGGGGVRAGRDRRHCGAPAPAEPRGAATAPSTATVPLSTTWPPAPALPDPRIKAADRRRFLAAAGGVSLATVAAALTQPWACVGPARRPPSSSRHRRATAGRDRARAGDPAVRRHRSHAVHHAERHVLPHRHRPLRAPRSTRRTWRLTYHRPGRHAPRRSPTTTSLAMAAGRAPITLPCVSNDVGGNLVGNAAWRGVRCSTLLDQAGVHGTPPRSSPVRRRLHRGFPTASCPDGRTALVALAMNGEPLPVEPRLPGATRRARPLRLRLGHQVADGISSPPSRTRTALGPPGVVEGGSDRDWQSRVEGAPPGSQRPQPGPWSAGAAWAPAWISAVEVQVDDGPWTAPSWARGLN